MDDSADFSSRDTFACQRQSHPTSVWLNSRTLNQKHGPQQLLHNFDGVAASGCNAFQSRTVAATLSSAEPLHSVTVVKEEDDLPATVWKRQCEYGAARDLPAESPHSRHRSNSCTFLSPQRKANLSKHEEAPAHSPGCFRRQQQEQQQSVSCNSRARSAGCVPAGPSGDDGAGGSDHNSYSVTRYDSVQQSRHSEAHGPDCWRDESCCPRCSCSPSSSRRKVYAICAGRESTNNHSQENGTWCAQQLSGMVDGAASPSLPRRSAGACAAQVCGMQQPGTGSQQRSRSCTSRPVSTVFNPVLQTDVPYKDADAPVCCVLAPANSAGACNSSCFIQGNSSTICSNGTDAGGPSGNSGAVSSVAALPPMRQAASASHPHPLQGSQASVSSGYPACCSGAGVGAGTAVCTAAAAAAAAARAHCAAEAAVEARKEAEALAARSHREEKAAVAAAAAPAVAPPQENVYPAGWLHQGPMYRNCIQPNCVTHNSSCSNSSEQIKQPTHLVGLELNRSESGSPRGRGSSRDTQRFLCVEPPSLRELAQAPPFSPPSFSSYASCRREEFELGSLATGGPAGSVVGTTTSAATPSGGAAKTDAAAIIREGRRSGLPWKLHPGGLSHDRDVTCGASLPVTSLDPWSSPPTPTSLLSSSPIRGTTPWGWDETFTAAAAASSPSSRSSISIAASGSMLSTPTWRRMQQDSLARRVAAAENAAIQRQRRVSCGKKPSWSLSSQAARAGSSLKAPCAVNRRSRLLSPAQRQQQVSSCCSQPLSSLAIATLHAKQQNAYGGTCSPACRAVATAAERVLLKKRREAGAPCQAGEGNRHQKSKDATNRLPTATAPASAIAQAVSAVAAPVEKALETAELFEALGLDKDGRPKEGFAPASSAATSRATPAAPRESREKPHSANRMTSANFQRLTRTGNVSVNGAAALYNTKCRGNISFSQTYSNSGSVSSTPSCFQQPPSAPVHRCISTAAVDRCLPSLGGGTCYLSPPARNALRCGPNDTDSASEERFLCRHEGGASGGTRRSQSARTAAGISKTSPVAAAAAAAAAVLAAANALVQSASSAAAAAADSLQRDGEKQQLHRESSVARCGRKQSDCGSKKSAAAAAAASLRAAKKAAATASAALDTLQQQVVEEAQRGGLAQQDLLCEGCFSCMEEEDVSYCDDIFEEHCCAAVAARQVQQRANASLAALRESLMTQQQCEEEEEEEDAKGEKKEGRKKFGVSATKSMVAGDAQEATLEVGSKEAAVATKSEKKHKSRKSDVSCKKDESETEDADSRRRPERRKHSKRTSGEEQEGAVSEKQQKRKQSKVKKASKSKDAEEAANSSVPSRASSLKSSSHSQTGKRAPKHASVSVDADSIQFLEEESSTADAKDGQDPHPKVKREPETPEEETAARASVEAEVEEQGGETAEGESAAAEMVHEGRSNSLGEEVPKEKSEKHSRKKDSRQKKTLRAESFASTVEGDEVEQQSGDDDSRREKTAKKKHSSSGSREHRSNKKKNSTSSSKSGSRKNTAMSEDREETAGVEGGGGTAEKEKVKEKKKKKKKSISSDDELEDRPEETEGAEDLQVSKSKGGHNTARGPRANTGKALSTAHCTATSRGASEVDAIDARSANLNLSTTQTNQKNLPLSNAREQSSKTRLAAAPCVTQGSVAAAGNVSAVASPPVKGACAATAAADVAAAAEAVLLEAGKGATKESCSGRGVTEELRVPAQAALECYAGVAVISPPLALPEQQKTDTDIPSGTTPAPSPWTASKDALTQKKEATEEKENQQRPGFAAATAESQQLGEALPEEGEMPAASGSEQRGQQTRNEERKDDKISPQGEQADGHEQHQKEEVRTGNQLKSFLENREETQHLHQKQTSDYDHQGEVQAKKEEHESACTEDSKQTSSTATRGDIREGKDVVAGESSNDKKYKYTRGPDDKEPAEEGDCRTEGGGDTAVAPDVEGRSPAGNTSDPQASEAQNHRNSLPAETEESTQRTSTERYERTSRSTSSCGLIDTSKPENRASSVEAETLRERRERKRPDHLSARIKTGGSSTGGNVASVVSSGVLEAGKQPATEEKEERAQEAAAIAGSKAVHEPLVANAAEEPARHASLISAPECAVNSANEEGPPASLASAPLDVRTAESVVGAAGGSAGESHEAAESNGAAKEADGGQMRSIQAATERA